MQNVLSIVAPVFGLVGTGYAVARLRFLSPADGEALGDFTYKVAIPLLMLRIIATADLAGLSVWRLWIPFFSAFAASWIAGAVVMRRWFQRNAREGLVAGLAAGYGNTTMVGLPVALSAFGAAGGAPMALIVGVQMPIMMVALAFLMEWAEREDGGDAEAVKRERKVVRSLLSSLLGNPIILGMAAGGVWRLSGFGFDGLPATLVSRLAETASPLALFTLGMSLHRYGVHGDLTESLVLTAMKLLLMPLLVLALASLLQPPALATRVAIVAAACPTGVTPFIVANRFRMGQALAASATSLSTALSPVSFVLWLALADALTAA